MCYTFEVMNLYLSISHSCCFISFAELITDLKMRCFQKAQQPLFFLFFLLTFHFVSITKIAGMSPKIVKKKMPTIENTNLLIY